MRHTWTAEEDAILVQTNATHTTPQQAKLLGMTVNSIRGRRGHLKKRGLLPDTERAYGRAWTEDERAELESLLMEGMPIKRIAKRLRRGIPAIYSQISRRGGSVRAIRTAIGLGVRSACKVGRLLGVADTTVALWIERGWLTARRDNTWRDHNKAKARKHGRPHYLVTDEALMNFMAVRAAWPSWQVERIKDEDWRTYAADIRAAGAWLSTLAVAARYHYTDSTVNGWYQRGEMAGVATVVWRQTRYFWSADLEHFIPPQERRLAA